MWPNDPLGTVGKHDGGRADTLQGQLAIGVVDVPSVLHEQEIGLLDRCLGFRLRFLGRFSVARAKPGTTRNDASSVTAVNKERRETIRYFPFKQNVKKSIERTVTGYASESLRQSTPRSIEDHVQWYCKYYP